MPVVAEKKDSLGSSPPLKSTARGTFIAVEGKRISLQFFRTKAGNEPVRAWLKAMSPEDKRLIGQDIQTVEFGWPVGMPICRPMGDGLHEIRTELPGHRTARVFFCIDRKQRMIALHAILKKTRTTPASDLELARQNKREHERALE
jgi:phage-related protein